ncbi:MAG TPA: N-acyl homoserine lactonase family protein [Caldimonas sp.]|nr:N-acyl homoserine lactonase family protein [Caldimonas sp.]
MHLLPPLRRIRLACAGALLAVLAAGCAWLAPGPSGVQRLYVLYCGEAQIPDVSAWSPGFNVGKAAVFSDNCYLIRHGNEWMLWDSGYSDSLVDKPEGIVGPRSTALRKRTLVSQLAEIGVAPDQIQRLAFSHSHGDHVGNGNLFTAATLYIQKAEYEAAFGPEPGKFGFVPATYDRLRAGRVVQLDGDFDVFGDGSVRILSTPGHTPGHQSLLVRLPETGAVVLSGDAAHFEENFTRRRVPGFNFDKEQSLQSMDKLDRVLRAEHARLWINHDAAQNATLLHAPKFYQ